MQYTYSTYWVTLGVVSVELANEQKPEQINFHAFVHLPQSLFKL